MWAIECTHPAIATMLVKKALRRGVILLQSGPTGSSITIAPPLTIEQSQLERAIGIIESIVETVKR
jgi:4-aminobutyrate aminotransferase-like enzyme